VQIIDEYMNDVRATNTDSSKYIECSKNSFVKRSHIESNPIIIPKPKTYTQSAIAYLSGFLG